MWILQIRQKGSDLTDLVKFLTDELCFIANVSKGSPQQSYSQASDPRNTPVQRVVVPSDVLGTLAVWAVDSIKPLEGPAFWMMLTACRSSGMVPTRVPSSKNQVFRSREGTRSCICMVTGLNTRLNPRAASGSP